MKFEYIHRGKWVVSTETEIVAADKDFFQLKKKVAGRKDAQDLIYTLVPDCRIAG